MRDANEAATLRRLGGRLRTLRERRGLTQEQVGERAGFTSKYISEIERGQRDVPFTSLWAILDGALGASVEDLAGALPAGKGAAESSRPYEARPLSRGVEALARRVSDLPPDDRARVLGILRTILAMGR